ncbi:MAG: 3-oxoacyl-ACP reductase FabG [Bacillota bacterium]|jgi:3-oxoacyl-[acyl-carrier protein] reductase|nr:3-oxoacyl-ACP reductase FabG [Bacillota bacterium]HOB41689.1 3-oxoacyl-ACP reductase FabG [Bacillota bacterium]HOO30683.1 3-oxoacyl-ACP reductase FabG [Bacillota bacterium]HPZ13614.1 3-oxoacyl-ACP reductase FabG [Bacillota bacterium]HQD79872.1 3-oxoacyl-ACP reductase FabG [Bacillota bacterium]
MRLDGKVAIITGSGRGLGKEAAFLFAEEGAKVVVCDINRQSAEEVALAIVDAGGEAMATMVDVTDSESVQRMVDAAMERFGTIDVLVNNAGITADAQLVKMTEDQWDRVIAVNLKGVYLCTKAVAPIMIAKGSGRIINTSSVVGIYGNFGQSNYVATKAGVIGMTKVWAKELGRKGITVNAVAPGFTMTEMMSTVPEKVLTGIRDRTPLGRLGEPRDIAYAYLYLASNEASFVNGATIQVDGGLTL